MQTSPPRRQRWLWPLLLVSLVASSACERGQDCELFRTCPDSLFQFADTLAGTAKAESCRQCLQENCQETALSCALDIECNFSSRCLLMTQLSDYQSCVRDLYMGGFTVGSEDRYPWEGTKDTFGRCLHNQCRNECVGDPFACGEKYRHYDNLRLKIAVRSYPDYEPLRRIKLRACLDPAATGSIGAINCKNYKVTDDHGVASFDDDFDEPVRMEELYFEIEESPPEYGDAQAARGGEFPRTLYYPGRLGQPAAPGEENLQLLAIYVVKTFLIEAGNEALGRGRTMLKDRAQSLILADSCVWEDISAPDLRIHVEGAEVKQCHDLKQLCDGTDCPPCVWYAREAFPAPDAGQTDGTGAGIVGLDAGLYTISVERLRPRDGMFSADEHAEVGCELVANRKIRMENGAMTIARTWPMREIDRPEPRVGKCMSP